MKPPKDMTDETLFVELTEGQNIKEFSNEKLLSVSRALAVVASKFHEECELDLFNKSKLELKIIEEEILKRMNNENQPNRPRAE